MRPAAHADGPAGPTPTIACVLTRDLGWFVALCLLAGAWAFTTDFAARHPGVVVDIGFRWTVLLVAVRGPLLLLLDPAWGLAGLIGLGPPVLVLLGVLGRAHRWVRVLGYAGVVLWFAIGLPVADAYI